MRRDVSDDLMPLRIAHLRLERVEACCSRRGDTPQRGALPGVDSLGRIFDWILSKILLQLSVKIWVISAQRTWPLEERLD